MGLLTWESEDMLRRVRDIDRRVHELERICFEILRELKPQTYAAPAGVSFAPDATD